MEIRKFNRVSCLSNLPRSSYAQQWLERLATEFRPIMMLNEIQAHDLVESINPERFGRNLLRGVLIEVRLRQDDNLAEFLSANEVVDTVCHELAHTIHFDHSEKHTDLTKLLIRQYKCLYGTPSYPPGFAER
jgi:hypothetical protein